MFKSASFLILLLIGIQPAAGQIIDVPFVKQEKNGCGAAVISMVMSYWHQQDPSYSAIEAKQIMDQLYSHAIGGIQAQQMIDFFRSHQFHAFAWNGSLDEITHHLAAGRPLIAVIGPKSDLHYVVVAGFSAADDTIYLNDPARRKLLALDGAQFEKEWNKANRWMLLAVPESDSNHRK